MSITNLLNGGSCRIPKRVAVCPECGARLWLQNDEWDSNTGLPTESGFSLECPLNDKELDKWENDDSDDRRINEVSHAFRQSDWQPIRDEVWKQLQRISMWLKA